MPRTMMLLGLVALLVLAAVLLLGESDEPAPRPDPTQPGAWDASAGEQAGAGSGERRAPMLKGTTGAGERDPGGSPGDEGKAPAAAPTGPYRFEVRDHESDAAIAGVAFATEEGTDLGESDAQGRLEIEDAGAGSLAVLVTKGGYVEHRSRAVPGETVRITLHRGVRILGRVVRTDTRGPAAAAAVVVWDEDLGHEVATLATDEEGRFLLPAVRPHHPLQLIVRAEGLAPHVEHALFSVSLEDYEIRVGEGGHLWGRVLSPSGDPVSGATVWLYEAGASPLQLRVGTDPEEDVRARLLLARAARTQCDASGRYDFRGVALGEVFLPTAWVGPRHLVGAPGSVRFEGVGEERQLDLVVREPAALRVRLEDEAGEPVGGVDLRVHVGAWQVPLLPADGHADGGHLLEGLTPGPAHVQGLLPGAPAQGASANLESGTTAEVRLVFARGRVLRGVVEDKHGAPIWKANVTWSGFEKKESATARTAADGTFELRRLVSARGTLSVAARDLGHTPLAYESRTLEDVVPAAAPLRVTLRDGTRIRGRFPDLPQGAVVFSTIPGGTPFDAIDLRLGEERRFDRRGPALGAPGSFVFRTAGLPPLVLDDERPFQSEEVRDVGALRFEQTNPRLGRVVDEHGRPVHGALVRVTTWWSDRTTRTDEQGDFALPRMPDEPVPIVVVSDGYPPTPAALREASQFTRQVIPVRRSGYLTVLVEGAPPRAKQIVIGLFAAGRDAHLLGYRAPPKTVPLRAGRAEARFHVPPGHHTVVAATETPPAHGTATVEVGASEQRVVIKLRRGR